MWDLIVSVPDHCLSFYFIFYAAGEYKILHRQFFEGNTLLNSFFNKNSIFFFVKKVEG